MEKKKQAGGKALLVLALSALSREDVLYMQEKKEPSASPAGCPGSAGTPSWSLLGAMYF